MQINAGRRGDGAAGGREDRAKEREGERERERERERGREKEGGRMAGVVDRSS